VYGEESDIKKGSSGIGGGQQGKGEPRLVEERIETRKYNVERIGPRWQKKKVQN